MRLKAESFRLRLGSKWLNVRAIRLKVGAGWLMPTQMPDDGAKLLLLYCCLEHLFVPKGYTRDNKKYLVGGLNALRPDLLQWFDELYKQRCAYAHKGFLIRGEQTRRLMIESIQNILALVAAKLR